MNKQEIISQIEALYSVNRDIHGHIVSIISYRLTPEHIHNAKSKIVLMEREINWLKGEPTCVWRSKRIERMESELELWKQLVYSQETN